MLLATETCRCPKVLYTNYWSTLPYLKVNEEDNKLEGIFSGIVTDMIHTACGICPGHGETGRTKIDIVSNGKQRSSAKRSVLEVLEDIDDAPQISFPIYGNKYITRYLADYAYINLVESPGVAFIATSSPPGSAAMNMINAVLDCVPMIVLSACMAYISGFVIWTLVSKSFPRSRVLPNHILWEVPFRIISVISVAPKKMQFVSYQTCNLILFISYLFSF